MLLVGIRTIITPVPWFYISILCYNSLTSFNHNFSLGTSLLNQKILPVYRRKQYIMMCPYSCHVAERYIDIMP